MQTVFWPSPALTEGLFHSSGFSREGTLSSALTVSCLVDVGGRKGERDGQSRAVL